MFFERDNSLTAIPSGYSHVSANTIESLRAGAMSLAVGVGELFSFCVLLPSCTKKYRAPGNAGGCGDQHMATLHMHNELVDAILWYLIQNT